MVKILISVRLNGVRGNPACEYLSGCEVILLVTESKNLEQHFIGIRAEIFYCGKGKLITR